jgi:hypothetical protein
MSLVKLYRSLTSALLPPTLEEALEYAAVKLPPQVILFITVEAGQEQAFIMEAGDFARYPPPGSSDKPLPEIIMDLVDSF